MSLLSKRYEESPSTCPVANLPATVIEGILSNMVRNLEGTKLSIKQTLKDMVKQIGGDNPSPLEKLLAERISVCWLDLHAREIMRAVVNNHSFRQAEYMSRQVTEAQRRYLSAIRTLATVRKLNLSAIQVNIADKQIIGPRIQETTQGN